MSLPELTLPTSVNDALLAVTVRETLESLETRALDPSLRRLLAGELSSPEWQAFLVELSHVWNRFDHAVIRGTPALSDERIALLLALALNAGFKPTAATRSSSTSRCRPGPPNYLKPCATGTFIPT